MIMHKQVMGAMMRSCRSCSMMSMRISACGTTYFIRMLWKDSPTSTKENGTAHISVSVQILLRSIKATELLDIQAKHHVLQLVLLLYMSQKHF